jgi:hypothetical protein
MGKVPAPNIIWKGAHSSNFTVGRPGGSRNGQETFHHVVGSADSAVAVFKNPSRGASSHFVVTATPGVIYQCVNLKDTAWTDGNWQSNLRSITVEHHGDWRNGYNNAVVLENAAKLVAWLRDQGLVTHAVRHRQVSTTGTICPADFPVEAVWNRATQIIKDYNAPKPAPQPEWLKNRKATSVKRVYAQKDGLRLINLADPSKFADSRVFAINQDFEIGSETTVSGVKYYLTVSSTNANLPNGIRASEVAQTPYVPPVVTPPKPETPAWVDSIIDIDNREMYVLRATPLIDLENGHPYIKDGKETWFQVGDVIKDVSAQVIISGKTYMLTEYAYDQTKKGNWKQFANGIDASDLSLDPKSTPPGTPANPTEPDRNAIMAFLTLLRDMITEFLSKFKK